MESRTRIATTLGMLIIGLTACLGATTCEGADRSNRGIDSGQPRDLINQPLCRPSEQSDDLRYCDFARI